MKLYVKTFLATGIPFGVITGLLVIPQAGVAGGLIQGLGAGLFFGLFMALILVTLHKFSTKNLSNGSEVGPKQSKTIVLDKQFNRDTAFSKCVDALNKFGAKIDKEDKANFEVLASSKASWKSFGEELTIRLKNDGKDNIEIEILSAPKIRMTLVDYGKGKQNVEKLSNLILS